MTDQEFIDGIDQMINEAPDVGLCSFPFKIIRDYVINLVTERNQLKEYRTPKKVQAWNGTAVWGVGKCPNCNAVFLDRSTPYCGNCGQALSWGTENEVQES